MNSYNTDIFFSNYYNLQSVHFEPIRSKPKLIAPSTRLISHALSKFQVIVRNSDWFIALFASVVINRSSCLGFGFRFDSHLKTALKLYSVK